MTSLSTALDMELHSSLEAEVVGLIELASQMARDRDESIARIENLERLLDDTTKANNKLKRDRIEERDNQQAKLRKLMEERLSQGNEIEKLKTHQEEYETKLEVYRKQVETLRATIIQNSQGTGTTTTIGPSASRLSKIFCEETMQHLTNMQHQVRALENRVVAISAQAQTADSRAIESSRLVTIAHQSVKTSLAKLDQLRTAHKVALDKSRSDSVTISTLQLDVESLSQQVSRYREEIQSLNQQRRAVESELESLQLTVVTSIQPLLTSSRLDGEGGRKGMVKQTPSGNLAVHELVEQKLAISNIVPEPPEMPVEAYEAVDDAPKPATTALALFDRSSCMNYDDSIAHNVKTIEDEAARSDKNQSII